MFSFFRKRRPRILVGMSGGVDSSVSAALLLQQGYDVVGGFIKNWSDTKDLWTGECAWRGERRDAMRVCAQLGIPLLTFDFEAMYRERVLGRLFDGYAEGQTPNPDVLCNEEIKFGLFFDEAMKRGFDGIATGHYARIHKDADGTAHLLKGIDPAKDQSYFLYRVSQQALAKSFFPIGGFTKPEVRLKAESFALPTAQKPDSQGICFVGKLNFHDFLRKKIAPTPGDIVTPSGDVVGRHDGLDAYTIGQRQGLMVSTGRRAWYVAQKRFSENQLVVVDDHDHPLLLALQASVRDLHWCAGRSPHELASPQGLELDVQIRYHQPPVRAQATQTSDGLKLRFFEPVWALAPGQSAVLYQGDECLGGGILGQVVE